jgi:hemolysin III
VISSLQQTENCLFICRVVGFATPVQFTPEKVTLSPTTARPGMSEIVELPPSSASRVELRGLASRSMRTQTASEELANTWSAVLGVAGACAFALVLLWHGDTTVGQWVFAVALLVLFLTSTLYHGLIAEPAKKLARLFDHVAIFALIAATYTPFALGPLRAYGGILLFALEWGLAVMGLCFVLCGGNNSMRISNALYIGMGWLGLFFISDFINHVPVAGNGLILAGGIFYTAGVAFYSARGLRFSHLVWHLFVLAGAICHAVAVYAYSG